MFEYNGYKFEPFRKLKKEESKDIKTFSRHIASDRELGMCDYDVDWKISGSEKQIAWANTIRMKFYEEYSNGQNDIETIIKSETESKFWIDNRNHLDSYFIEEYAEKIKERQQHKEMVESNAVYPKEIKHDGIVEIIEHYNNMYDHRISVKYKKDAEFTVLVKSCGYSWDGNEWYRKISRSTGKFKDMAKELGNKLLENGFVIYIQKDKNAYIKLNEKAFNL